jgi:hypothetical protein
MIGKTSHPEASRRLLERTSATEPRRRGEAS